ncbi:MAG: glycosyltransferase family 2 protein [Dehalococcoidia bacterium]|nr:Undecaprenyl-phosphate mannosyltransferase [Chloroflexota bacterium]
MAKKKFFDAMASDINRGDYLMSIKESEKQKNNVMLSIIIPTLNEEEGIAKVICSIPKEIKDQSEVIVVDVSADLTPIIAERLGAKVIRAEIKGKGRQMRKGVEHSQGEILIFLDGDGTDPPQYIPKLLEKLEEADLVLGCRSMGNFRTDDKSMRRVFKVYGFFIRPLFRLINFKASDPLAGFRVIRKKDWQKLDLESNDFKIETEMNIKVMKQGFVVKEVAIPHLKRCGGGLKASKLVYNPRQWFEISKTFFKYLEEEKLTSRIKNLELKVRSKFKI